MAKPVVAVLGTGLMGAPMARNLLARGLAVRAWNRTPAKAAALAPDGAEVCASPAAAAAGADIVLTMLSDGQATGAMVCDPAVAAALAPGALWLDMSSTKPEEARAQAAYLARSGHGHLDAPVSGGTKGAEAATLAIMVGGHAADFARAQPVLAALGRATHVGPAGAGQLAKLANQAVVGIAIGAVAEAMLLLQKGGADPVAVRAALKGGFADSTILQLHGARMTAGDFAPGGRAAVQLKDLDNVLAEASGVGLNLPLAAAVRDRYARLCRDMGGADLDHAALFLELLDLNGLARD